MGNNRGTSRNQTARQTLTACQPESNLSLIRNYKKKKTHTSQAFCGKKATGLREKADWPLTCPLCLLYAPCHFYSQMNTNTCLEEGLRPATSVGKPDGARGH